MNTKTNFAGWQKSQVMRYFFLVLCLGFALPSFAQEDTKAPYFFVKSENKDVDELPLKRNSVDVNIAGVIADVKLTQEYENKGKNKLEAIYIFPASTRAAVYAMEMTVGDRKIAAKIEEKSKAKLQYEEAKKQGKTASLLEQKRPNVFQMNVGNIQPGDKIKVELFYTELLVPENGEYEFVYPTVVGPRYAEEFASEAMYSDTWVNNPYSKSGEMAYEYNINASIQAGMTLSEVKCNTHKVDIDLKQKNTAVLKLNPLEKNAGNRDFVFTYKLAGNDIQSGLLLFEGKEENFFLAMVQPPKVVTEEKMPPREYVFILDVSGSMRGFPLEVTKELLQNLLQKLRPEDRFNVMLFESGNMMLAEESMQATKNNIKSAVASIDAVKGGGSTNLLGALKKALAFKETQGFSRNFVVVTDGYITIEQDAFDLIRQNLGKANLFAVGAGSSVNRFLIEGMARAGQGEPLFVMDKEEGSVKAEKFRKYISAPVLTNINVDFGSFQVYDMEPISFPDVLAERPVVIFGKYKGKPSGQITLSGLTGGNNTYTQTIDVGSSSPTVSNKAIRYLWAREKIKLLNDYNARSVSTKTIKEITDIGLKYNLLTNYTSFIAVDPTMRDANGDLVTVKQALPMPKGVTDNAFGRTMKKTGSVERSNATNRAISTPLGRSQPVFSSKAGIVWKGNKNKGVADNTTYIVTVSDLMATTLLEKEVTGNSLIIDLTEEKYKTAMGGAITYRIQSKDGKFKSSESILKMLNDSEAVMFSNEAGTLLLAKTLEDKIRLAKFYEMKGLVANAFSVWQEVLEMENSEANQQAFNEFMIRNQLN